MTEAATYWNRLASDMGGKIITIVASGLTGAIIGAGMVDVVTHDIKVSNHNLATAQEAVTELEQFASQLQATEATTFSYKGSNPVTRLVMNACRDSDRETSESGLSFARCIHENRAYVDSAITQPLNSYAGGLRLLTATFSGLAAATGIAGAIGFYGLAALRRREPVPSPGA